MAVVTEKFYIESADDLKIKLVRYQNIIEALETQALTAAGTAETSSYSFDDGQISVSMTNRSPKAIAEAIDMYEKFAQRIYNKLNGRVGTLRPWQGMRGRWKY
jgi:hypothetical protein